MSEKEEIARSVEVSVAFHGERCIHSRNCVIDRPDVFVPNVKGEWIHPDRATADEVLEIAHNCPSGAIQCSRSDGSALEQAPIVNTVRVRENGPLAFRGELTVAGEAKGMRAICWSHSGRDSPPTLARRRWSISRASSLVI